MRATATATPELDFTDPDFLDDPYPLYARLRSEGARWSNRLAAWLVADHRTVAQLARSPHFVRGSGSTDAGDDANRSLQRVEREEHARLRATVGDVFHGAAAGRLAGLIARRADELVARCIRERRTDLMAGLAHPLSVDTIAQVLGIPEGDLRSLTDWSVAIARSMGPAPSPQARSAAAVARAQALDHVESLVAVRVRRPRNDLVSRLIADARLSPGETQAMVRLLLFTGAHPTALAIGNALDLLARFPLQWEALRRRPALLGRGIEECLRFESVVQLTSRRATADCVVGGARVRAGEQVALLLGSANRDERVFPRADAFDVERVPGPHLAFGRGIHACLAPVIARLEVRATVEALLRANVVILPDAGPVRLSTPVMRGFEVLPARIHRR